jgi:hypothetical protein
VLVRERDRGTGAIEGGSILEGHWRCNGSPHPDPPPEG